MQISREIGALPERYRHVLLDVVVRDASSMDEVLDLVRAEAAAHPASTVLVTLDDLDQMLSTSGQVSQSVELEVDTDDLDLQHDPDADHILQLRQFHHAVAQLRRSELRVPWAALVGRRTAAPGDIDVLAEINHDPTPLLDDVVLVLRVPVDDAADALAAYPNGYFSDDWNVFENHAVARHLSSGYGYRLFGIGASWLGFVRDAPLDRDASGTLVAELGVLYGSADAEGWARLADVLTRSTTLFLVYTDDFGVE